MKKIKNIRQLRSGQQKLLDKQHRLEDRMQMQWETWKLKNKQWLTIVTRAYSLLGGRLWQRITKQWFDRFK